MHPISFEEHLSREAIRSVDSLDGTSDTYFQQEGAKRLLHSVPPDLQEQLLVNPSQGQGLTKGSIAFNYLVEFGLKELHSAIHNERSGFNWGTIMDMENPDSSAFKAFKEDFIKAVLHHIQDQNLRVVPTSPRIAGFLRKNRQYKEMLPVGIRI